MVQPAVSISGNLNMVRLLKSFGGRALPIGFVADQLGISEQVAHERIGKLAADDILKVDNETVSLKA